jgi:hypothetical protein
MAVVRSWLAFIVRGDVFGVAGAHRDAELSAKYGRFALDFQQSLVDDFWVRNEVVRGHARDLIARRLHFGYIL